MLKNNGKKTAICVASTACLCLLLLLVALQHHRAQVDQEEKVGQDTVKRSLQQDVNAREEQEDAQLGSAQAKRGFSAYFTKLTRGRREVEKPARSSASSADPPPAEDISADDIFIAVKTTKKFHQSRLNLLLDTWISRNVQQVKKKKVQNVLDVIHVLCVWHKPFMKNCMHKLNMETLEMCQLLFFGATVVAEFACESCTISRAVSCR